MATAKENGISGCFSAVLRQLLCWHGTSTHPGYDLISPIGRCPKGEAKLGGGKDELGSTSSSGRRAGVVARLMGLETLPDAKWVPGLKSPDLFLRSRSVNFMDYLLEVDLSSQQARRHPHSRVRTSVSFCEAPVKVLTSGHEPKENNFIVVITENRDEPARTEMKMQGKSRKNEVQRKKKKTSDCWRDKPRTRSQDGCNSESRRPNNVRAAYEKKCGGTYGYLRKSQGRDIERGDSLEGSRPISNCDLLKHRPREGRTVDSTAVQAARILDPVIVCKKKAAIKKKKKKEEVIEFKESGKQMDDAVNKAHELAGAEAGNSRPFSPGSSEREEICVMIEGHVLDCLLEEFVIV